MFHTSFVLRHLTFMAPIQGALLALSVLEKEIYIKERNYSWINVPDRHQNSTQAKIRDKRKETASFIQDIVHSFISIHFKRSAFLHVFVVVIKPQ